MIAFDLPAAVQDSFLPASAAVGSSSPWKREQLLLLSLRWRWSPWCWEWDSGAGTTNDYCDASNDGFNDDVPNDNYISNDYISDDVDDKLC